MIALARHTGATIVTQEGAGSLRMPSIPLVVRDEHFTCPTTNLLGLIRAEKWTFR